MSRPKKYIIAGLIGAFFLGSGILALYNFLKTPEYDREWRDVSATTTGVVVGGIEGYRNKAYIRYPIVQFVLPNGVTTTFESKSWYGYYSYPDGSVVPVTYSLKDPANYAFIDDDPDSTLTKGATIFLMVVYFLLAVGCFGWIAEDVGYYKKFDKIK